MKKIRKKLTMLLTLSMLINVVMVGSVTPAMAEDPPPASYTVSFLDHDDTVLATQIIQSSSFA